MKKNVHKIKIKLENIWIDLIMGIYAPYRVCGIRRGLWVTFGGGRGLRAAFGRGVRQEVGVEGTCGSIGAYWKGVSNVEYLHMALKAI